MTPVHDLCSWPFYNHLTTRHLCLFTQVICIHPCKGFRYLFSQSPPPPLSLWHTNHESMAPYHLGIPVIFTSNFTMNFSNSNKLLRQRLIRWRNSLLTLTQRSARSQQIRGVDPLPISCWANVYDAGPTWNQHWVSVSCCWHSSCWHCHNRVIPAKSTNPTQLGILSAESYKTDCQSRVASWI